MKRCIRIVPYFVLQQFRYVLVHSNKKQVCSRPVFVIFTHFSQSVHILFIPHCYYKGSSKAMLLIYFPQSNKFFHNSLQCTRHWGHSSFYRYFCAGFHTLSDTFLFFNPHSGCLTLIKRMLDLFDLRYIVCRSDHRLAWCISGQDHFQLVRFLF